TTAAQILTAGVTSATMMVQLEDSFNNVATATSVQTVSLTTTSAGSQFRDTLDTTTITSVTIGIGESSASFKYTDTLASSPVLTATANVLPRPSATQTEPLTSPTRRYSDLTTAAQILTAGVTSTTITVQLEDAFNNVATATSVQTVSLT